MTRVNLGKATSRLLHNYKQYKLGETDCFIMVVEYMKERGIPLPDEFEGVSLESYGELYRQDPAKAKEIMTAAIDSVLPLVSPNKVCPGDILLLRLRGKAGFPFLAINGGNGIVMFSSEEKGAVALPLRYYRIVRCWSCQDRLS